MSFSSIEVQQKGPVLWLSLARPEKMNALSVPMIGEMLEVLAGVVERDDVRVVVLTGQGRAFCAGADLIDVPPPAALTGNEENFFDLSDKLADTLSNLKRPLVVAINGVACAGGLELLLFGDVVFAKEGARIGDVHSNFGLLPGLGGSVRLTRAVGVQRARYLMFSGELITAQCAVEWGLVAKTFPEETFEDEVQKFCEGLARKSLKGLMHMRNMVNDAFDTPLDVALRHERTTFREYYHSVEVAEGQAAFREKRDPDFVTLVSNK